VRKGSSESSMTSPPCRMLNRSQPGAEFAGQCAFAIMTKAPLPNQVKTRLTPPLTPEQAATLQACFLRDTVENLQQVTRLFPAQWICCYTPADAEAAFAGILPEGALLLPQRGESLGERLVFATEDLFSCGFSSVCLVGADSPTVPTEVFVRAARALSASSQRAVLGPCEDGGYYLIGLQRPEPNLFTRISWSSAQVTMQTLERAQEIALPVTLLTDWYDVDDPDSLQRLCLDLHSAHSTMNGQYPARHTSAYLQAISPQ
jgi:uncharacterized protein